MYEACAAGAGETGVLPFISRSRMLDAPRSATSHGRGAIKVRGVGQAKPAGRTRLERVLLEADRLREESRRRLEHEVRQLEELLRLSR
jgi:hypothetical protein